MQATELQNLIVCNYLKHFPESYYAIHRHALSDGFYIVFHLGKAEEWPNKISNNDPLHLSFNYWKHTNDLEIMGSFCLKPTNSYMYGSTLRLRKKTINHTNFNEKQFDKYFANLKANLLSQRENWHPNNAELIASKLIQK